MKMQLIVLFTILITLLNSCGVTKTKLTEKELKWITVYKQNDMLIYESSQGVLDTSYIVKSEAYYPEYIPIEVHDKYLPHSAVVLYKNKNLEHKPSGNQLIYMVKKYPDKQVRVFINYLSSVFIILDLTNDEIVYRIENHHDESGNKIKYIYKTNSGKVENNYRNNVLHGKVILYNDLDEIQNISYYYESNGKSKKVTQEEYESLIKGEKK